MAHNLRFAKRCGESKRVKIEVPYEAFCFFDDKVHAWRAEKGAFTISLGSASDDIRATLPLRLR
ncbi:MAG: fibronectin type III-like domain-contianing protein [Tidjanibacter sp.]|nr:fibronectin type III-like domain-contianing protein [Tidjanibacter sp.]